MHSTMTLADLAVAHPAAARVFYRHHLDFCCGGQRPFEEACRERGLDPDDILRTVTAEDAAVEAEPRWNDAPLDELIDHIVTTYHARLRQTLPELVAMADTVERQHAGKAACPAGLAALLRQAHAEVLDHLQKEEQILFPLIVRGMGARAGGPVHVMEFEHLQHKENLRRLRELTHDLTPPAEACATWRGLYRGLQQFEEELMNHIHLENNVLFRRALAGE